MSTSNHESRCVSSADIDPLKRRVSYIGANKTSVPIITSSNTANGLFGFQVASMFPSNNGGFMQLASCQSAHSQGLDSSTPPSSLNTTGSSSDLSFTTPRNARTRSRTAALTDGIKSLRFERADTDEQPMELFLSALCLSPVAKSVPNASTPSLCDHSGRASTSGHDVSFASTATLPLPEATPHKRPQHATHMPSPAPNAIALQTWSTIVTPTPRKARPRTYGDMRAPPIDLSSPAREARRGYFPLPRALASAVDTPTPSCSSIRRMHMDDCPPPNTATARTPVPASNAVASVTGTILGTASMQPHTHSTHTANTLFGAAADAAPPSTPTAGLPRPPLPPNSLKHLHLSNKLKAIMPSTPARGPIKVKRPLAATPSPLPPPRTPGSPLLSRSSLPVKKSGCTLARTHALLSSSLKQPLPVPPLHVTTLPAAAALLTATAPLVPAGLHAPLAPSACATLMSATQREKENAGHVAKRACASRAGPSLILPAPLADLTCAADARADAQRVVQLAPRAHVVGSCALGLSRPASSAPALPHGGPSQAVDITRKYSLDHDMDEDAPVHQVGMRANRIPLGRISNA